jgi:hypothetical protein
MGLARIHTPKGCGGTEKSRVDRGKVVRTARDICLGSIASQQGRTATLGPGPRNFAYGNGNSDGGEEALADRDTVCFPLAAP